MLDNHIGDAGAAAIAQGISSPECNLNTLKLASMSDYLFFLVSTSPLLSDEDLFVLFGVLLRSGSLRWCRGFFALFLLLLRCRLFTSSM